MITLCVNGREIAVDAEPDTPLLWALREDCALTGTKFGCGVSLCGACTVLVNGAPVRSCVTPVSLAAEAEVTTIEGMRDSAVNAERARITVSVQAAWTARSVAQCGYCQSGLIMAAVSLLSTIPDPTDADINNALRGHICRCGTYERARAAIHDAAKVLTAPESRDD